MAKKKKRFRQVYLNYNTYNFMEIYTKIFNIFKANFDFEIVETEMGQAVKMPARLLSIAVSPVLVL